MELLGILVIAAVLIGIPSLAIWILLIPRVGPPVVESASKEAERRSRDDRS